MTQLEMHHHQQLHCQCTSQSPCVFQLCYPVLDRLVQLRRPNRFPQILIVAVGAAQCHIQADTVVAGHNMPGLVLVALQELQPSSQVHQRHQLRCRKMEAKRLLSQDKMDQDSDDPEDSISFSVRTSKRHTRRVIRKW